MKIKTRFQIVVVFFIVISIVFGASIFLTVRDMNESMEKNRIAHDMVKDVFELNILSNDYIMYHEERPKSQWQSKYESLETLLKKALEEFEGLEEQAIVEKIYQTHKSLETTFFRLVANYEQNFTTAENSTYLELEQRLISQLSINSLTMVTEAFQLSDACEEDVASAENKVYLFTMIAVVILCVIMAIASFWVSQGVLKPIKELQKGIEIIAKGNLDHKIETHKHNEIGNLAKSYEKMRVKIKKRTTALNTTNIQLQHENQERKRAEKELERLIKELDLKNKELQQIVFVASHDLRSPLVNVQGFSKELNSSIEELTTLLVDHEIPDDVKEKIESIMQEEIPEDLHYIHSSIAKMDALLNGLLRISRVGTATISMKRINMNKMISDVASSLEFQIKEAKVDLEISELPNCKGDWVQINQVCTNLVDNAIKYRNPNRPAIIKISGYTENGKSIYCVEDNGIGISRHHQDNIFEIFHRLNPNESMGEGLGLTIVRRILDRHNGKIWVESKPGKGSKFYISLPNK